MALPYFFIEELNNDNIVLEEDTSKHIIQVLRMKVGEELMLTDGKGTKALAVITNDNRKKTEVKLLSKRTEASSRKNITIAISLVKNASRFEWFLEKATEIGVTQIIPLVCERTEKEKFRLERMQQIVVSAMLQSQQCWMPVLNQPTPFNKIVSEFFYDQKFIAHCIDDNKRNPLSCQINHPASQLILIGPEGDFTPNEIEIALQNNFQPVSLGNTRLRTETAGLYAAVILSIEK